MPKNNWTREETIVAFNVYCKVPFKSSSKTNPTIIKYANIIGRRPSALNMKVGNFRLIGGVFDIIISQVRG